MKKLRILVSAYACNPVASRQLHPGEDITGWELVKQLSRFHEVWVITHSYNHEGIQQGGLSGVNFYYVNLPIWLRPLYRAEFGVRIYYYLWQLKALFIAPELHRQFHFNVFHHITFNNDWMPSFIGALLPIPFIWGPVGGGQKPPKGFMGEYSLYGRIFEIIRIAVQWLGRHSIFRRMCVKRARAILVCNRETKAKISKKYVKKIHFFPVNGISYEDITINSENKKSEETFRVLTAGRFEPIKGFGLSLRAFEVFSRKFSNSEFIIVGEGTEKSKLTRLVKDLSLEERVRFIPWLPRKKLLAKMHSGDVFIFPSFRDGGGAVIVEAMACGKPVVCLDTGGPGFHIQEQWGIKVVPKSPEYVVQEMARALERLYRDKELRDRLGKAARERAKEFYLWDRLGEKMQEIYEKALKEVGSKEY